MPWCAGSRIGLEAADPAFCPAAQRRVDLGCASSWKSWLPSLRAASRLLPATLSLLKRAQLQYLRSPPPRKHHEGAGTKECPPALSSRRGAAAPLCSPAISSDLLVQPRQLMDQRWQSRFPQHAPERRSSSACTHHSGSLPLKIMICNCSSKLHTVTVRWYSCLISSPLKTTLDLFPFLATGNYNILVL